MLWSYDDLSMCTLILSILIIFFYQVYFWRKVVFVCDILNVLLHLENYSSKLRFITSA
jgi:hypothetical protein